MKKIICVLYTFFFAANSFATSWTVSTSGFAFSPDSITIMEGDTVTFVLGGSHNAQEVSQTSWSANSAGPVTGFQTNYGVTENVTGLSAGTHYYVCGNHAGSGMKGIIIVQQANPTVGFVITSSSYSEGVNSFGIAVAITSPNSQPTSVDINVAGGGTAASGVDYTYSPVTVTFPANSSLAQIITVQVTDDQLVEGNETFTFQLASPTNNASINANSQHTITLIDNDTLKISMGIPSLTQFENIGVVNVPVTLSKLSPSATSVTLQLDIAGTTATSNTDFFFNDTTITWSANTTGTILVPLTVVDDAIYEPDETVRIQLTNPTNNAVIINDTFLLTIQNNDAASPASIRFVKSADTVQENVGAVRVIAEVNNPSNVPVSYIIARNDTASTATIVTDYTFQNAPFTHGLGVFYDTVYFYVIDELLIEPAEKIVLNLTPVSGAIHLVADSVYSCVVLDNDTLTLGFNGAGYSYVEDTDMVQIRIHISSPVPDTTWVSVSLATGSAANHIDFNFSDTTIVFLPNSIDTQSVWVQIIDDTIVEPNEQINFNLVNATGGAHLGISAYTITIIDNDTPNGIENTRVSPMINMYPNPATNSVILEAEDRIANVTICGVAGNILLQINNISADKTVIDISALPPGIYLIDCMVSGQHSFRKLIKQL